MIFFSIDCIIKLCVCQDFLKNIEKKDTNPLTKFVKCVIIYVSQSDTKNTCSSYIVETICESGGKIGRRKEKVDYEISRIKFFEGRVSLTDILCKRVWL